MLTVEERSFLEEMAAKHLPGRHRQEDHGNDASPDVIPGDKLKLAGRIQLGPGEKLLSSRKIRTRTDSDTFDLVAADVDTPQGRQIRLGVVAFAKNWAAGPDPETERRKAELNQEIEALEDGPELFGDDLDHLDALREEVDGLGNHYETRYDHTVTLAPSAVAAMRADIESGVAQARQLKKDFEKFWDDHTDEEGFDGDFGDTELTHAEGILPGGPEGDLAYEVTSDDEAEWNVRIGIRPPDAKPDWYIGSIADDEAVIGPAQLKAFLKDLDELAGGGTKAFIEAMARKHLPGQHDQRDHGRRGRGAVAGKWKVDAEKALADLHDDGDIDADTAEAVAEVYSISHGGLSTSDIVVGRDRDRSRHLSVRGAILDASGKKVGIFARAISIENGRTVVDHELLRIDGNVQGQGFAQAFNAQAFDWYRQSGVEKVELLANADVGGYAWARAGYDFSGPDDADEIRQRAAKFSTKGDEFDRVPAERLAEQKQLADEMWSRLRYGTFGSDDYPTPYEIAELGRWPGAGRDDWWAGKVILMGSAWSGVTQP